MTEFRCIVCDRPLLRTLPAYERLPRVTSDCKPWPAGGQLADFVTRACPVWESASLAALTSVYD